MKKSFALLTTLLLVIILGVLSVQIVETTLLNSNLNKLKYLHLQARIYLDDINKYVKEHNNLEIQSYKNRWNDTRFKIDINQDENNNSIYYTSIKTSDNSHIRLSEKILK